MTGRHLGSKHSKKIPGPEEGDIYDIYHLLLVGGVLLGGLPVGGGHLEGLLVVEGGLRLLDLGDLGLHEGVVGRRSLLGLGGGGSLGGGSGLSLGHFE